MIGYKKTAALLVAALGIAESSQAALLDRGRDMVFDDVLNITWTKDANLFKTLADASGNPANFVQEIIKVNSAVQISRQYPYHSEYRNFPSEIEIDFNAATGHLSWFGANAFVGYLNSISYSGYDNWRLPNESLHDGYLTTPNSNQELSYMFYTNLGGAGNQPITSTHNNFENYALFRNIESYPFWSGSVDDVHSWAEGVHFANGKAETFNMDSFFYAWAVRDGDVAAVPVPAAFWLFASGLGLLSFTRRKQNS
jgi:hypothetical protein